MRKLGIGLIGVLVCVSCFGITDNIKDTSNDDNFNLFQGSEKGMQWDKPLTRGQAKVVLSRMGNLLDTKIETLDEVLSKKITDTEKELNIRLDEVKAKADKGYTQSDYTIKSLNAKDKDIEEDIALSNDKIAALQELIQKTRDQLAYIIRGTKDEINTKAKTSADEEYARPFYTTVEIGSIGTNGNKIEAGYDYKVFDIDYVGTITPLVRYDNGLSFLVKGSLRWGQRR